MATARQKVVLAGELGMFMLGEGKILTGAEYRALDSGPLRWATMRRLYGNWNRAIRFLEQAQPDIWEELQNLGKNPSAPKIDLSAIEDNDETSSEE